MGPSFTNIEAAVHLRMGDAALAEKTAIAPIADMRYSFGPSINAVNYARLVKELSPEMELKLHSQTQVLPLFLPGYAAELEEAGRFSDAARQHEALLFVYQGLDNDLQGSAPYARATIAHALAGDWELAKERADFARTNMNDRIAQGEPEDNASSIVELLDMFSILEQFENGEVTPARRMFAARSQ